MIKNFVGVYLILFVIAFIFYELPLDKFSPADDPIYSLESGVGSLVQILIIVSTIIIVLLIEIIKKQQEIIKKLEEN